MQEEQVHWIRMVVFKTVEAPEFTSTKQQRRRKESVRLLNTVFEIRIDEEERREIREIRQRYKGKEELFRSQRRRQKNEHQKRLRREGIIGARIILREEPNVEGRR